MTRKLINDAARTLRCPEAFEALVAAFFNATSTTASDTERLDIALQKVAADTYGHASDCAVNNQPAYVEGPCNCGWEPPNA